VWQQQFLFVSNSIIIMHMQQKIVTPVLRQKKRSVVDRLVFAAHLSMLGAFAGLVGYLAIACHHVQ